MASSSSMSIPRRIWMFPVTRLLICLAIFTLLTFSLGLLLSATVARPFHLLPMEGIQAFAALAALVLVGTLVERGSFASFGLGRKRAAKDFGIGFLAGGGLMSAVVAIFAVLGWFWVRGLGRPGPRGSVGWDFVYTTLLFLLGAIFEEVLFRGIVLRLLDELFGSWIAVGISALVFGMVHAANPDATWFATVAITLEAGLLLGGAWLLTKSLWLPIGLHFAWNLFEGGIFGLGVSGLSVPRLLDGRAAGPAIWTGGPFGPEAGLVCFLLGTTAGALLLWYCARTGRIFTPPWVKKVVAHFREPDPSTPLVVSARGGRGSVSGARVSSSSEREAEEPS